MLLHILIFNVAYGYCGLILGVVCLQQTKITRILRQNSKGHNVITRKKINKTSIIEIATRNHEFHK